MTKTGLGTAALPEANPTRPASLRAESCRHNRPRAGKGCWHTNAGRLVGFGGSGKPSPITRATSTRSSTPRAALRPTSSPRTGGQRWLQ
jgi:hypothetical protein